MDTNVLGEDVQNVNVLTVIASESYDSFAKGLQTEIAEAVADRPRAVTAELFVGKVIKDDKGNEQVVDQDTARAIHFDLIVNGYIDKKGILTDKYYADKANHEIKVAEEVADSAASVIEIIDTIYDGKSMMPENARSNNVELHVDEKKLDECVKLLRDHNPNAVLVTTPWDQLTGEQLMEAMEQKTSIAMELEELEKEAHEHHHHDHDEDDACDDPDCTCHHHHDNEDGEHEHHHHHHHDDDDEDEEHEHHHHHHDHDDDDECDDPDCACHHHHDDEDDEHEHHHHHHGHDADEVFVSWGVETHKKFTTEQIEGILKQLEDAAQYGMVLRAKGYVASNDSDRWIHFDYVPGESDIREGGAMVTGRVCVIGSKLNESAIASLFGA